MDCNSRFGVFTRQRVSILPHLLMLILPVLLTLPANARIRLYSREKADSLESADSLKHADSRWIADSGLKARYFAAEPRKPGKIRLYSRTQTEQKTIDSIRIIDSLRLADSIRTADSIIIARYGNADVRLSNEKKAAEAAGSAAKLQPSPPLEVAPTASTPGYVDNLSARTIAIAPDNPYAPQIDSLQTVIDRLNDSLHKSDASFRKMKVLPISEKRRYINFLLTNHLKDSAQVLDYCTALFELYKIKQNLLIAIRNSQDSNSKSFISYHIEEHLKKMGELSELLLSLSPTVPFAPARSTSTGKPGE